MEGPVPVLLDTLLGGSALLYNHLGLLAFHFSLSSLFFTSLVAPYSGYISPDAMINLPVRIDQVPITRPALTLS